MTFRPLEPCVLVFSLCLWPALGLAQSQQAPASSTPAQSGAAATTAPPPQSAKPPAPDYPDPRTFTLGIFYWDTPVGQQPNLYGGAASADLNIGNASLPDLGKARASQGVEMSYPITRTGTLRIEIFQTKGDGTDYTTPPLNLFGTGIAANQVLVPQYSMINSKIYLDDLLFPHKFPVAKFRLKSLWEFQLVHLKTTVNDPAALAETGAYVTAVGTKQIFLPTFGLAAEYALTPHILLRVDGTGFAIPHHSDIWDGNATISWRHGMFELYGGGKIFHFKTSPQGDEYVVDTILGAIGGLRLHWTL